MLEKNIDLSIRHQSILLDVSRSSYYYSPLLNDESHLLNIIKDIYLSSNCVYGYRKITNCLHKLGFKVNHKKVLRLMNDLGICGVNPRKRVLTTVNNPLHKIYPYLLDGLVISSPNHVWATDITYIKISSGFMYFIAIVDLYSRYIINHDISVSLEADFCVYLLKDTLNKNRCQIFNSDQGCQFTSKAFVELLLSEEIKISMDHKGRCFDNIIVERLWRTLKQECIYHRKPETIRELEEYTDEFVQWYNNDRIHQSLNYRTPKQVYFMEERI